jgi:hypothetical protein
VYAVSAIAGLLIVNSSFFAQKDTYFAKSARRNKIMDVKNANRNLWLNRIREEEL